MKKILFYSLCLLLFSCSKHNTANSYVADTVDTVNFNFPVEGIDSIVAAIKYNDSLYYKQREDSLIKYFTDASIAKDKMYANKIDSISIINDSLNVELFKAKYKLNKISQYNAIAAKGNNIKYLRGWIRRALEE